MKQIKKRLLAALLTAAMLLTLLPTAALASLVDNTPDQNRAILEELEDFWGDEKTAGEALALLQKYGLVDGDGNVMTDWSGTLTIGTDAAALSFEEAAALDGETTVSVNGRACTAGALRQVLEGLAALGVYEDGALAADWAVTLDGEAAVPGAALAALRAAGTSEEAAPAVTVLGRTADGDVLLSLLAFLDAYGLLTDAGAKTGWELALPGGSRKTDLAELLALLEDENADRGQIVTVDGAPITLGDFEIMMDIEREIKRIQDDYFTDHTDELTPEHRAALESLAAQLEANGGIMLYNTAGADELVFPSGVDQNVTASATLNNGTMTVKLDKVQSVDVTFSYQVVSGSVRASGSGQGRIAANNLSTTFPVSAGGAADTLNGTGYYYVRIYDLKNAIFSGGRDSWGQAYSASASSNMKYKGDGKAENGGFGPMWGAYEGGGGYGNDSFGEGVDGVFQAQTTVKPSVAGLVAGNYDVKLTLSFNVDSNYSGSNVNKILTSKGGDISAVDWEVSLPTTESGNISNKGTTPFKKTWNQEFKLSENGAITIPARIISYVNNQSDGKIETWLQQSATRAGVNTIVATIDVIEKTSEATASLSAPAGDYRAGETIPIIVSWSFPMQISKNMSLTVNGTKLTPLEDGATSNRATFLYTVPADMVGGKLNITNPTLSGTGANTKSIAVTCDGQVTDAVKLNPPRLIDAVKTPVPAQLAFDPKYNASTGKTTATATVDILLPEKANLRELITPNYLGGDGALYSSVIAASTDGGKSLIPLKLDNGQNPTKLTATFEIAVSTQQQNFVMELYTIDGTTHAGTGLLFGRYASFSVNEPAPLTSSGLGITLPDNWPANVFVNDPPALQLKANVNAAGCTWSQTEWVSTNPKVATIGSDGKIAFTGKGTVQFYLKAVNGGIADYQGAGYESARTPEITVSEGSDPYLRAAAESVTIRAGEPVVFRWASNLAQKNEEYGETATTFTIEVKDADGNLIEGMTKTVTFDPKNKGKTAEEQAAWPDQSVTLTGLVAVSVENSPSYTISVSASTNASVPGHPNESFTSKTPTKVFVISQPVSVNLVTPDPLFLTNEQDKLTVNYTLENLDTQNAPDFRLTVTNNATGERVVDETTPPEGRAGNSDDPPTVKGSFDIPLTVTNGFRTIYDVTLEAKNNAESDWSRKSFTLYVYDKSCLDLVVEAVEKNGKAVVSVDGDSVTMSNEAWIASLPEAEILALKRDINLQTALSINYGDHNWGEALDRIRWKSEKSGTAAVNYRQGSYYENIETLPYTSFAPATQFLLSGKNNGATTVEAIHDLSGGAISSSAEVTVETLKDKLYLFQCYPAVQTTLTYQNSAGRTVTHQTDGKGQAAVYEADGIKGDVYLESKVGGETYLGTIYHDQLVSQEKDAVSLELYPLNSINLRKAASAPVYLKNPDGSDYSGTVQVRAGVYRNGVYCADAKVDNQPNGTGADAADYAVSFENGAHTFLFDLTQFDVTAQGPVTAADNVKFVFELRAVGYYPVLMEMNGSLNADEAVRMGQRIVSLEAVPQGQENAPFIAAQTLYFSDSDTGLSTDVKGRAGKVGPSKEYPALRLNTTVLWWGTANGTQALSVQMTDNSGAVLTGQEMDGSRYPFCSMPVTRNSVLLDEAQIDHLQIPDMYNRGLTLHYYGVGGEVKRQEMPWRFINALHVDSVVTDGDWKDKFQSLKQMASQDGKDLELGTGFIGLGLKLATNLGVDMGPIKLQLSPTKDPTVYRGLVYLGLNNIEDDNVSKAQADTERSYDVDYTPGYEDLKAMFKDAAAYGESATNQVAYAAQILRQNSAQRSGTSKDGDSDLSYALSGYFETEVYWDYTAEEWKMVVVTGGLTAGGGYGYHWIFNTQVGPVPMFLELGLGASAVVHFDAALDRTKNANDYLTQLRINAYMEAFGGFGFDYTIIAAKIGLFGQMSLDAQLRWLNAIGKSEANFGYQVDLKGEIGFKLQLTVLFISYEQILWSQPIQMGSWEGGDWEGIQTYWDQVGKGNSGNPGLIAPDAKILRANRIMSDQATGTEIYEAQGEATLVDRGYLENAGDRWSSGRANVFAMNAIGGGMDKVVSPSYPGANPVLSEDGAYMFYLDDLDDPTDATALRVAVSGRTGDTYQKGTVLSDAGYGDSYVKAAGSGENSVVVWSRLMDKPPITEPGDTITPNAQAIMLNSAEIMAATRSNGTWKVERLTSNDDLADLAPAVATNGNRTLVAWRQAASGNANSATDFDARDYIMYKILEDGTWSEAQTLYIGDSGPVKGLEAAMLPDGQAIVTFVADTDTTAANGTGQEIFYGIVAAAEDAEGRYQKNEVSRFVRITSDGYLDENPQLAVVDRKFILGWHTLSDADGNQVSDIRLAQIDGGGNRTSGFVDNLSTLIRSTDAKISGNFRFSKGAGTLDKLSILWSESALDGTENASSEYVTGLRFTTEGGKVGVTAAQHLAQMDPNTAVNVFDAYTDAQGSVNLVIMGTFYDPEKPVAVTVSDGEGFKTIYVAEQTTSVYRASGYYSDDIRLDSVIPDYANIRLGASLPVQVNVTNLGTKPVESLSITIGGDTTTFAEGSGSAFVAIAPGESRGLLAYYTVPADKITDPAYTVSASFTGGGNVSEAGKLTLNVPDLGITSANPLLSAQDGKRLLQFTLYNQGDSKLAGSGKRACFNLYSDPECTEPIDPQYLTLVRQGSARNGGALLTISDEAALGQIDEGRYTLQYSFDLAKYIQQEMDGKKPFADDQGEVRDGGVTLYARTWVEMADGKEMLEFITGNNTASVSLESLLKQAEGTPVTIESIPSAAGDGYQVEVRLQNNSIVKSERGNITVTLLDENNQILGWQQSFDTDEKLLTLESEARYSRTFDFPNVAAASVTALVTYDEKVTLDNDATLSSLYFDGVPVTLDMFKLDRDSGTYTAAVVAEDITSTVVIASPRSSKAAVSVAASTPEVPMLLANGETEPGSIKTVAMSPGGTTTITVTVTAQDNSTNTYVLTITNKNSQPAISGQPAEASVTYGADTVTLTVSAAAEGNESAKLTYQWYHYDGEGAPEDTQAAGWKPVTGKTAATYVIGKGEYFAGTHYYYCKVTSTNAAGNSFPVDSNIVSVNVAQANTPTIVWPKITTQLTFGDKLSKAGSDLNTGSLTFPNGFTPAYGIGTFTWNQPDAIPTVDTTQANAVYTPSGEIQRNYEAFALENGGVPTMLAIRVEKAEAPTVVWPAAAGITYGQTLADAALSGQGLDFGTAFDFTTDAAFSGNPIGAFAWHAPETVPTVANGGFQVDYAASDFVKTNYQVINETTYTTPLTVNRAEPVVNVETDVTTQKIGNPVTATITVTNLNNAALTTGFPEASEIKVTGAIGAGDPRELTVTAAEGRPGVYQATFQIANDAANKDQTLAFSVTLEQSANYAAVTTPATANVAVTDKAVHVQTLTGPASVTYGDPASFTTTLEKAHYGEGASAQPGGGVTYTLNGTPLTGREQTLTVSETSGAAVLTLERGDLPAGKYTLTARYGGDPNYQASEQSFNFTVLPRPVTAAANSVTAYAGAIPALTVSYDGLPEGVDALDGVTPVTGATKSSPAGVYPITLDAIAGADALNYDLTAVPGTLTLKPRTDEVPVPLPEAPDAENRIPAVAIDETEQAALKDQLTEKNLENLKLMVTPIDADSEDAKALLAKLDGYRAPENGAGFYDVSLVDGGDQNRVLNFDGSATLTFPYPEGVTASAYHFVILHLKDGAVSAYAPATTEEGLKITVKNGFSPFLVAYAVNSVGGGSGAGGITVTVSAGKGGTVSPALSSLKAGATQTFAFQPDEGYRVADVKVNGVSVGAVERYTAEKVSEDLVIEVVFEPIAAGRALPFTDVPETAWYREAVEYVYERGLFAGTGGATFSPDDAMTRAMLVTVLYRAAGEPSMEDEIWGYPFADVDAESWYGTAVYWARLKGIALGTGDETFLPDGSITREQLAVMLYRYAGSPATGGSLDQFADKDLTGSFAADAVRWAVEKGIITGTGCGLLDPKGDATRAQVAAMLMRFLSGGAK